jgi:hypothetical protein
MIKEISNLIFVSLFSLFGCSANEIDVSNNFDSLSGVLTENISPTESFETSNSNNSECKKNYNCGFEEICFENSCYYYTSLIYQVEVLKYVDFEYNDCNDFEYDVFVDYEYVKTSSVSKCGASWPNEYFYFNGDQIPEIRFWRLGNFNKRVDGKQACYWNDKYKVCEWFPFNIINKEKMEYSNDEYSLKVVIKPFANLDVSL